VPRFLLVKTTRAVLMPHQAGRVCCIRHVGRAIQLGIRVAPSQVGPRTPAGVRRSIGAYLHFGGDMQKLDFSLFLAIAAGIASFLTAIYSTAYALHFITPS